jgi:superfamily II DNA/RNA helicase
MNMGYVNFKNLRHLILDEADRMLHMGFIFDIQKIVSFLPTQRQTLMFSATMSPKIRDLAKKLLRDPAEISLAVSKPAERVKQSVYLVEDSSKNALVRNIVKQREGVSTIIFAGTKQKVKDLERELSRSGLSVACIHSDLEQAQREEVLRGFRSKRVPVLVATDILSRGIDIDDIGLVINYDVPRDGEDYVHRIGRTARAESEGEAITLVNSLDRRKLKHIEELIESPINQVPLPEGIQPGVTEKKPGRERSGRPGRHSGKSGQGKDRKGPPRR